MKQSIDTKTFKDKLAELKESNANENSLKNMDKRHTQRLINFLSGNLGANRDYTLMRPPQSPFELIKDFTDEHDAFMKNIDVAFSEYGLTVEQADLLNEFKKEALNQFHTCLDKSQEKLTRGQEFTSVGGYIEILKQTRPTTSIIYTDTYNSGMI